MDFGPDGKLYVCDISGNVRAYDLSTLTNGNFPSMAVVVPKLELALVASSGTIVASLNGLCLGLTLDPNSTASAPILWVSYSGQLLLLKAS